MRPCSNSIGVASVARSLTAGVLLVFAAADCGRGAEGPQTLPVASTQPAPDGREVREAEERADRVLSEAGHGVFVRRSGFLSGRRITAVSITGWNREALGQLKHLGKLRGVDVCSLEIRDAGLRELARLEGLTSVRLSGPTTDEGLKALLALKDLEELDLNSAEVTDEGLKAIGGFPNLQSFRLGRCRAVTEAGLEEFARVAGFEAVKVSTPRPRDAGIKAFRKRTGSKDGTLNARTPPPSVSPH